MPATKKDGAYKLANDITIMTEINEFDICSYPANAAQPFWYRRTEYSALEEKLQQILVRKLPVWKRAMDMIGSVLMMTCLSPVLILIALYIKIVSPGPVLFKQDRVGYKGKIFTFLKYRTMKTNNSVDLHKAHAKNFINSDVPMAKLDSEGDSRIIFGGRLLRKSCIDELPQLYNILRGEMGLVGPRPCIPYEAEEYLIWHAKRFDIVPGLTGLWQVSGKNNLTFKQMIRLDIEYEQNLSFWLDAKILVSTIPTILQMVFEAAVKRIKNIIQ
jgi:lipopolysaccharide/colanic/teichoic acid biosynthesis glycosyltransferase